MNVDHDTRIVGVQSIIVIEDNVRYYSSFLPIIYTEILNQSQRLISEGINLSHKFLRMRARPKILLCRNVRGGLGLLPRNTKTMSSASSPTSISRATASPIPRAGIEFAKNVKARQAISRSCSSRIPPNLKRRRERWGHRFSLKDSPTLLHELRQFMIQYFSFGDFVFRTPEGSRSRQGDRPEVARGAAGDSFPTRASAIMPSGITSRTG